MLSSDTLPNRQQPAALVDLHAFVYPLCELLEKHQAWVTVLLLHHFCISQNLDNRQALVGSHHL